MNKPFEELLKHVKDLEVDFSKFFESNNQAAGTRVRNGMQRLKILAQRIREDVQAQKNSEPKNSKP